MQKLSLMLSLYEEKTTIESVLISKLRNELTFGEMMFRFLYDKPLVSRFTKSPTEDVENKLEDSLEKKQRK